MPTAIRSPLTRSLFAVSLVRRRHHKVAVVLTSADAAQAWRERVPAVAVGACEVTDAQIAALVLLSRREGLTARRVVFLPPNTAEGLAGFTAAAGRLREAGVVVSVGEWRTYWLVAAVADLTGPRLRKMFHSAS